MKLRKLSQLMNIKKDIEDKRYVLDVACKLCNTLLRIFTEQYYNLESNKCKKVVFINRPKSLALKTLKHGVIFSEYEDDEYEDGKEEAADLPPMTPLEGDEKVK